MKKIFLSLIISLFSFTLLAQIMIPFDQFFEDKTLRIDYFSTGTKKGEIISLDALREEPFWAGSKKNLLDRFNNGKYMVKVFDLATNQLIFSKGYATLFGEWLTTDEATRGFKRSLHNSILIPYPRNKVQVTISTRDKENILQEIYSIVIDPKFSNIKKDRPYKNVKVEKILYHGDPSKKVDLLIIGDGYAKNEAEKLRRDARRFTDIFFRHSPFKEKKDQFNVWMVEAISEDSGPDDPRKGIFRSTAVGSSFNTFDSARYLTTAENRRMRDIASNAPYDTIVIMVNTSQYGGGGIYNHFSVFASDNEYGAYLFVHEFGHGFAGLADEYYSSQVSYSDFYPPGVEPCEPNITALLDKENIKWKEFLTPGIPIPTPEDKEKYEKVVGCFEGAGYAAKGLYRPMIDCKMFSKGHVAFCTVCKKAISDMIDFYSE